MTVEVGRREDPAPTDSERRYLYAVVPAADATSREQLLAGLEVVHLGDLCAVVGPVPMQLARSSDAVSMDVLEAAVRDHERTVEHLLGWATSLVPFRFGTVLTSRAAVSELLHRQAPALHRNLQKLEGRCEWGVAVFWGERDALDAARQHMGGAEAEPGSEGPGHRYLMMRRRERCLAQSLTAACERVSGQIEAVLDPIAELRRRFGLGEATRQRDDVEGGRVVSVLAAAALASRADEPQLTAALDAVLRRYQGLRASLSGPWPPYSFVDAQALVVP